MAVFLVLSVVGFDLVNLMSFLMRLKRFSPYLLLIFTFISCSLYAEIPVKTERHEMQIRISGSSLDKLLITKTQNVLKEKLAIGDAHWFELVFYSNSFNRLTKSKGFSSRARTPNRLESLGVNSYSGIDLSSNYIQSDGQVHIFTFSRLEIGSKFGYLAKYKLIEPRFLPLLFFQDNHFAENFTYEIEVDNNIDLAVSWFNIDEAPSGNFSFFDGKEEKTIVYSVQKGLKTTVYRWEVNEVNPYEPVSNSLPILDRVPHVAPYIRGVKSKKGEYEVLLKDEAALFSWYEELLDLVDDRSFPQDALRDTAESLVKGLDRVEEKINAIYAWTQKNIQYLAYEYAMGGFIPRPAGKTFVKSSGDCKDMALLITTMLNHVGVPAKFAWVGAHDRSYSYRDLPTPMADNHAIAVVPFEDTMFFLDATNRFVSLSHPSSMIQGREVMVYMNSGEFKVVKAPVMPAFSNRRVSNWDISMVEGKWSARFESELHGYSKEQFLKIVHGIEEEVLRNYQVSQFLLNNNPKSVLVNFSYEDNARIFSPASIRGTVSLQKVDRKIEGESYFRPVLMNHFDAYLIPAKRKEVFSFSNTKYFEDKYTIHMPEGTTVLELPENVEFDDDFFRAYLNVKKLDDQTIELCIVMAIKVVRVEPQDFERWNNSIRAFKKISNTFIIYQ